MRPLSFSELEQVAGGYWHSYSYSSTGGQTLWDREWVDEDPQTDYHDDSLPEDVASGIQASSSFYVIATDPNVVGGLASSDFYYEEPYNSNGYGGMGGFIASLISAGSGTYGPTSSPDTNSHASEEVSSFFSSVLQGYSSITDALTHASSDLAQMGLSSQGQQYFSDWVSSGMYNAGQAVGSSGTSAYGSDIVVNGYVVHYDDRGFQLSPAPSYGITQIIASDPSHQTPTTTDPAKMTDAEKIAVETAEQHHLADDIAKILQAHDGHFNVPFNYMDPRTHELKVAQFDLAKALPILQNYTMRIDNSDPHNGGVGQAHNYGNGQYGTTITSSGLTGYLNSKSSLDTLILHEISHLTGLGMDFNRIMQNQWGNTATFSSSVNWKYNEEFANNLASAIGAAIGDPIVSNPTVGLIYQ